MKSILNTIAGAVLTLALQAQGHGQSLDGFHYAAGTVAVLQHDWYKNPPLPCWSCASYSESNSYADSSNASGDPNQFPRLGSMEPRYCQPMVGLFTKAETPEFVYKLILNNGGVKTIRAVEWEYIFIDREMLEVARHQFRSEEKISPGKRKTLVEYSTSPSTKVISVKTLSQPESDRFIEKVTIRRVTYGDGSVWENLSISQ